MRPLTDLVLARPGSEVHVRRREPAGGGWLVFLHGAGADGRTFDPQVAAAPDALGVCVWDARGHGRSTLDGPFRYGDMADDLAALVGSLGSDDITLVGHSMGGNLAQTHVDTHPGTVARVVLLDCTDNHGPLSRRERVLLAASGPMLAAYPWSVAVRQSAAACGTQEATRRYTAEVLGAMGQRRFVEVIGFWREALSPEPGHRIPVPALLVVGDRDRSGNIADAMRAWPARDPGVRLVVVPDAGHVSTLDNPEVVCRELAAFLGWT